MIKPGDIVICDGKIQGPELVLNKARGVILHHVVKVPANVYRVIITENGPKGTWLLYEEQIRREVDIQ